MFKKILIIFVSLFLVAGCKEKKESVPTGQQELTRSTIYFFHGNIRCVSCHRMEKFITEVFNQNFYNKLDMKIINMDTPENKHFVTDYNLYTQSVVLVKVGKENKYKNLDRIWTLVENENKFKTYLKYEIDSFLVGQGE